MIKRNEVGQLHVEINTIVNEKNIMLQNQIIENIKKQKITEKELMLFECNA